MLNKAAPLECSKYHLYCGIRCILSTPIPPLLWVQSDVSEWPWFLANTIQTNLHTHRYTNAQSLLFKRSQSKDIVLQSGEVSWMVHWEEMLKGRRVCFIIVKLRKGCNGVFGTFLYFHPLFIQRQKKPAQTTSINISTGCFKRNTPSTSINKVESRETVAEIWNAQ